MPIHNQKTVNGTNCSCPEIAPVSESYVSLKSPVAKKLKRFVFNTHLKAFPVIKTSKTRFLYYFSVYVNLFKELFSSRRAVLSAKRVQK